MRLNADVLDLIFWRRTASYFSRPYTLPISMMLRNYFVAWPTASRFADWSKRSHVTFIIHYPSVCPINGQHQRQPAGSLLSAGIYNRYRSIAAGAVLHAPALSSKCGYSVMLTDDEGGSTQTCWILFFRTEVSPILVGPIRSLCIR